MRRTPLLLTLGTLTGAAIAAWSTHAAAQTAPGFALDRFEPAETGSEWFANDTLDIRGNWRPALGVVADYGYKPYVLLNPDGSENTSVVTDQIFLHVGGSLVLLDRLRLGVSLPIAVSQSGSANGGVVNGQQIVDPGGAGVGDLRAAADLRLFGHYGDAFTLGFGGRIWLPTGDTQKFLGDGDVRVGPHVSVAGDVGALAYAASVGVIYRGNDQSFAGHPTGSEADFGLAVGVRALDKKLLIGPELSGSTIVSDSSAVFGSRTTPLALLGSAHYSAGDFRFGLGAGPGLSHAAGTAAFRGLLSVEYAPGVPLPPPPPEPVPEPVAPPPPVIEPPPPPSDRDHDGIVDTEDACPDVPGVRTDDPKTNGCPSDRDHDGIPDTVDACPDVPGPANTDPTKNGCPLAFIKDNQIQITQQINFRFGLADLDPVSDPILDAVLKVMQAHTDIPKIRIEGHTDNKGSAALNKRLSDARAAAVATWLVQHGIERSHLTSIGFGMDRPIDTNDTDAGRARNRRVEFHIQGEGQPKP